MSDYSGSLSGEQIPHYALRAVAIAKARELKQSLILTRCPLYIFGDSNQSKVGNNYYLLITLIVKIFLLVVKRLFNFIS